MPGQHVVVGDFNLHHPTWSRPGYQHIHHEAEELIDIAIDHGLEQLLPRGTTTFERQNEEGLQQTTIDLVWASNEVSERLVRCGARRDWLNAADLIPILSEFDLAVAKTPEIKRKHWSATDWEAFLKVVKSSEWPLLPLHSEEEVDNAIQRLVKTICEAANAATPEIRITGRTRAGYTPEMAKAKGEAKQARKLARRTGSAEHKEQYRQARHRLGRTSAKLARTLHRDRVEAATQSLKGFWGVAKWVRQRQKGGARPTFTPTLIGPGDREYTTPEEKAALLQESLHPAPPEADLRDINDDFAYPEPLAMPAITLQEVERAISNAAADTAPGPDGIPNLALQKALPTIKHFLVNLFNECLRHGYCPSHFRSYTTVVIRKPGKDDYTDPNAYRPIALLNTIGKVMEAILAARISYLVERHHLLPKNHIGGRRGRSCELALHLIMEKVHARWRAGDRVASLLTLDQTGAFPNVNHKRLIHNMRKRRLPMGIIQWVESFLTDRKTIMVLLEGAMGEFNVKTGIPQGSPLSPILFLFFNADLIEDLHASYPGQVMVVGYIDDIAILVWSESATENCQLLARIHGNAEAWGRTHAAKFSPKKYGLIHMYRKHRRVPQPEGPTDVPLQLRNIRVEAKTAIKYLGVWLDTHLTGIEHVRQLREKATDLIAALSSIAGSTWGTNTLHLRSMYTAVLFPRIAFACSVWYIRGGYGFKGVENEVRRTLESIQFRALYRIAGAFRTTSRAALEVCLHVPPPMIALDHLAKVACLRILASPVKTFLHELREATPMNNNNIGPLSSPLQRLESLLETRFGHGAASQVEEISPFVVSPWWSPPEIRIDNNREAALAAHTEALSRPTQVRAYTDGSGQDGGVGAAVVSNLGSRRIPVGTAETHSIYAAELEGINEALAQAELLNPHHSQDPRTPKKMVIFTDNQAAIQACHHPSRASGQYIVRAITEKVDTLRAAGWHVLIQWIPGHEGAHGNELADTAAKEAASEAATQTQGFPPAQVSRILQASQIGPDRPIYW